MKNKKFFRILLLVFVLALSGCNFPTVDEQVGTTTPLPTHSILIQQTAEPTPTLVSMPLNVYILDGDYLTPTPDPPHTVPYFLSETIYHTVLEGDTLGEIAEKYEVTESFIAYANNIYYWNWLNVGQELILPAPEMGNVGPDFKLIPDSELVYGPRTIDFDTTEFADLHDGYLSLYAETVDGKLRSGPEIIQYVADLYSVNPRLLLAFLEYQSGWVTKNSSNISQYQYPAGNVDQYRVGLFYQLTWASNTLNSGYYQWKQGLIAGVDTIDGIFIPAPLTINAGTFALHYLFSKLYDQSDWRNVVSEGGFTDTYQELFGYPFAWAYEPLIPPDLEQPELQLPFEEDVVWNFTGGPHNGWDSGSSWAALDFSPPMYYSGCYPSYAWVVAVADGYIKHSDMGAVIQEIDGDGYTQVGWTILYMHIDFDGRIEEGQYVKAGDKLGHPSCEGGISTGTHLHIARRYNGEWILADGTTPFEMDGWTAFSTGNIYDGYLKKGNQTVEACECRDPINTIKK